MADATTLVTSSSPTWLRLCGTAAPISSIMLYMAPIPTVLNFIERKNVGDLPLLPYTSMLSNSFLWVIYGVLVDQPKLWKANGFGLVMSLFYFASFIVTAPRGMKSSSLPGSINLHIEFFIAVLAFVFHFAKQKNILPIGQLGVMINLAMYASPLAATKVVLDTKSSEAIPLPLTVASFLSCVFWALTGYFEMDDPYVYLPPLLGILFGLMQISLKIIYEDKSQAGKNLSPDLKSAKMELS